MRWFWFAAFVLAHFVVPAALAAGDAPAIPETQEPRIQARVDLTTIAWRAGAVELGELDIMAITPGESAVIVTTAEELRRLRSLGLDITVEIENMQEFYASRFTERNFGAYHTYEETVAFLDDLHATYGDITSQKYSIGRSVEGRKIHVLKISDNPHLNEDEPEVLITGLHHAREPMSLEVVLYYMEWLCENYGTDPDATFIVDNREIWFLPIVNPDGYVYNQTTHPFGGGMWRKNRRDNSGTECDGVDLNRNYPYMWGGEGSSDDPCSETYRGTSAASEPETKAVMDFVESFEFVTNINFHSVVGAVFYPWSYTTAHAPDQEIFRTLGAEMTKHNNYSYGQSGESLYVCSGVMGDWAYGEQETKNKIYAFCVEVGGSGFWPSENEIRGLNEECLWPQAYLSLVAGAFASLETCTLSGGDGDQEPEAGETLEFTVAVRNEGPLCPARNVLAAIMTDDAYVTLESAACDFGDIAPGACCDNASAPLRFTIDPETPDGHLLRMTLSVTSDAPPIERTFEWVVGEVESVFTDDMESGLGKWITSDGRWGITDEECSTGGHSLTDSPYSDYDQDIDTWVELADAIDLSHVSTAKLTFWHRYENGGGLDRGYVEVSTDGGSAWETLDPTFHGTIRDWEEASYHLIDYAGASDFRIRFRLATDDWMDHDGWYIDDVVVGVPPGGNLPPEAPAAAGPLGGEVVETQRPVLAVANAFDADTPDGLTYGFAVYADEHFTEVVASATGVPEAADTTRWTVDVDLEDGDYRWRAYAEDPISRGSLSEPAEFVVHYVPDDEEPQEPTAIALRQNRPNPFSQCTRIAFDLPEASRARLAIYGVDGRLVRVLKEGVFGPGPVDVEWNGTDEEGLSVACGVYLAKLEVSGQTKHRKVVVLR